MNLRLSLEGGKAVIKDNGLLVATIENQNDMKDTLRYAELFASSASLYEAAKALNDYFQSQKHETNYVLLERHHAESLSRILETFKHQ